jgi:hypothetical protein
VLKRQLDGLPALAGIRGGEKRISPDINATDLPMAVSGILDAQIFNLGHRPFTPAVRLGGRR